MPFNPEDPKWTAYVLGELDASERASIEEELAESAEARGHVDAIRKTTQMLINELRREPPAALSAEQHATIHQSSAPQVTLAGKSFLHQRWAQISVVAATVLILAALLLPATQSARESGRRIVKTAKIDDATEIESFEVGEPPMDASELHTDSISLTEPPGIVQDEQINTSESDTFADAGGGMKSNNGSLVGGLGGNGVKAEGRGLEGTVYKGSGSGFGGRGRGVRKAMVGRGSGWYEHNRSSVQADIYGLRREQFSEQRHHASGAESYGSMTDNPFFTPRENPLSTFSIDVDTASYSNIRRFLMQNNSLPPKGAVRIEEMINYFRYDYPQPNDDVPFSVTTEVAGCPWNAEHRLVRIGLKGREIESKKRPPSNLVFLLDVSGSMTDANKLPLVREAMKLLVEQLTENDRVAIVVYAGSSGCVLDSTTGDKQRVIREAIDQLEAGGSTNGAGGIQHAYEIASRNFIKGGTNRVILATDGDFNVGITNRDDLIKLITEQAKSGVFLTTLGFGMGNLKDATLEQLADKGNGNYAYIDDMREAKKVFVEQMNGTLVTIAKDVKIQIEFNPAEVASYRLIGYENRILAHEDFNDDKKDAGEIGAGHTVTALYEVVPTSEKAAASERPAIDPLKYQKATKETNDESGEVLTLKLRYKQPDGDTSKLIEVPVSDSHVPYGKATADFKFAASVALFGMILRDSPHKGTGTIEAAEELAREGLSKDMGGYRAEFVELIKQAKSVSTR